MKRLVPVVALLALSTGVRCSRSTTAGEAVPVALPGQALETGPFRREARVEDLHLITGELKAIRSHQFTTPKSEAWNLQIKWLAEDGTQVGEGEKVIEFDNTAIAQGREEKKLRLIQAEIDLRSRKVVLAADETELRYTLDSANAAVEKARLEASVPVELREKREWQNKQSELKKAESAAEKARLALDAFEVSAKSDLEVLRIALEKAAREIESVERDLAALTLSAPRAGIFSVAEQRWEGRKLQVGDTVWPGMELASIPDLSEMEAVGTVPEVDEGRVASGMPVRCILDTYPDRVFEGRLADVSPVGKEGNRRVVGGFAFRAKLEGADPELMRPGMSVRLEVVRKVWENALTVPRRDVVTEEGKTFVAEPSGERHEVRLSGCTPTLCIVEEAATEGEGGGPLALR